MNPEKNTIMIVDDIEQNIEVVGSFLLESNFDIITATSSKDCLNILEGFIPDLILLDIMMPELDGLELCKIIKDEKRTRDIPIIFLTAKTDTKDIIQGFEVGGIDYVTKPFNATELLVRVKTHLNTKKLQEELLRTNQKLEDMIRTKTKFFSIIAHDIRSPLSGIFTLIETLDNEIPESENSNRYVKVIKKSFLKLFDLLENLLHWSKMELGNFNLEKRKINIKETLQSNISLLNNLAKQKNISIRIMSQDTAYVNADLNMLNTIIRNLLSNSIKFTNTGGNIQISYAKKDDYLRIKFTDNGIGMSEKTLNNLFSVGAIKSIPGTKNEKGSGLGLLLCKEMIEKNGGTIKVESELKKGTTFSFTLEAFNES